MEQYMTIAEAATKWNISTRRIRTLCDQNRIEGCMKFGKAWAIPMNAIKPVDRRIKSGKYVKKRSVVFE